MPLDKQGVLNNTVVIKFLAKSCSVLLLLGVSMHEELNDCLEQMLGTIIFISGNKSGEHLFIGVPVFDNVTMGSEDSAHAQVYLVLGCHIELELQLTSLSYDIVAIDCTFCFLLSDESFKFFTGIH